MMRFFMFGSCILPESDVAGIYNVEMKRVNEAVTNNPNKFPDDFMFELTGIGFRDFAVEIFDHKILKNKNTS